MLAISDTARGEPADDADAAVPQLYEHHARALRRYVERFYPDQAGAEDIVQETFIRAWRHLPQLSSAICPSGRGCTGSPVTCSSMPTGRPGRGRSPYRRGPPRSAATTRE